MAIKADHIPGCLVRIDNIYSSLRESEKKVSDYIKDHYEEIIHLTVTELAAKAGTSEATIVRLCKTVGYKGFQDFKINLAKDIVNPSYQIHEALEKDDDILTLKKKVFHADIQALYDTLEVLSNDAFQQAADLIAHAGKLEFYGSGGSGVVALDAQHKFLKAGIKSFVYSDGNMQAISASLLGKGDVAIGISHSGSSKDTVEALEIAKKAGASTIAITNYGKSPILKVSDIALFTVSKETGFKSYALASRIAQLAIIDALFVAVAYTRYEKSSESIEKTRDATASKKY